jgi:hypothetical protein
MKQSLITAIALCFTLAFGVAQAAKHEMPSDAVTTACKGKKAGDEVTVDGKKTKCPAAAKSGDKPAAPAEKKAY